MTKRVILATSILVSSMFGATDAEILDYFKAQIPVPTVKLTVTSRVAIDGIKGMDYVSLDISDGSRIQKIAVFTQGDFIFPDVIDVHSGSIKQKLDKQKLIKQLSTIYKKEREENILVLGDDPAKETLVEFSDPECPFCGKEVAQIETKLKTYNLKYIFTPVHGRSSLEKSSLIYKKAGAAKTLEERVKILKQYFNGSVDEKVSDEEVARVKKIGKKYFAAGLKGVPFYINEKKLLN